MEVDGFTLNSPLAGDVLITHPSRPTRRDRIGRDDPRAPRRQYRGDASRSPPSPAGGEAIMVLNVDDAIPAEALDELKGIAGIETAFVVSLPQTSPQRPLFPVGIGARY